MIKVLLAEDMNLVRGALVAMLSLEDDIEVVAEVSRGDEILAAAQRSTPDVAVLDIELPGLDGLSAAEQITGALPDCRTIMLTALGNPGNLRRALEASVRGFLIKDAPVGDLAAAIRKVYGGGWAITPELVAAALERGENPLTEREVSVLREVATGSSLEEVAAKLILSHGTVRNYLSNGIGKLGARNRIDAIRIARDAGWL
ncbi:DNA-binding response regulator [Amycolatopsis sp. NPDC059657]|uniref:response regulator transcription factor n=1 Tax=Amycolatopsis sp. NPDC059657 TaxID=3346899 RepID=UPI00366F3A6F